MGEDERVVHLRTNRQERMFLRQLMEDFQLPSLSSAMRYCFGYAQRDMTAKNLLED